jgi:hypothetical protein
MLDVSCCGLAFAFNLGSKRGDEIRETKRRKCERRKK